MIEGKVPGLQQLSVGSQVMYLLKGHGAANPTDNLARARQLLRLQKMQLLVLRILA